FAYCLVSLSFPTRRSSDLLAVDVRGGLGWCHECFVGAFAYEKTQGLPWVTRLAGSLPAQTKAPEHCLIALGALLVQVREQTPPLDRKSTRLNSSHQIISYA